MHFKRHFRVPCARYAGGIRSGEECVLVFLGRGGGAGEQRGRARNFMKYAVAEFADEWYYLLGMLLNILTILCNKFIPGIVRDDFVLNSYT